MVEKYPSQWLEKAIEELSKLPGVGRKTALRLALFILRRPASFASSLGKSIIDLKEQVTYCRVCFNISDTDVCSICSDPTRDASTICVVESIKEVIAIEHTGRFRGVYHVLGGIISPIDGIGPNDLSIEALVQRVQCSRPKEIILALRSTMEGDTTGYYIYSKLKDQKVPISIISRGISVGDEIEYADELTLGSAILHRQSYSEQV